MKNLDVVKVVTEHANDADNGSFASALKKAVVIDPRSTKKSNVVNIKDSLSDSKLPDLVEICSLSEEEVAHSAEEAHKKKVWVEQAGSMLFRYKQQRDVIRSTEDWFLEQLLVDKEAMLTANIKEIESAGDENLHRHLGFCEFLSLIREVNTPKQMDVVANKLISEKIYENGAARYRIISKDESHRRKLAGTFPSHVFFWNNECYLPYEPIEGEEKLSGQKAIEHEVMNAIIRLSLKKKTKILQKMEVLRNMKANDNLSFILDGVAGLYMVEAVPVHDNKKIIRHGGVAIIRLLSTRKIEPVDGSGCFDWLSGEDGKWYISVGNAIFGKVPWDPRKDEKPEDTARRIEKWTHVSLEDKHKIKRLACELNKHLYPIHKKTKN